jgi:hypothetical protein
MPDATTKKQLSPTRNALSIVLFIVAGSLLAVAAYLFIQDWREDDTPPPPPSVPGRAQLANVHDILVSAGYEVEYGRESARVEGLTPVGQQLIVDGNSAFVFIYPNPEERQSETESLNPDEIELLDTFGDPVTTEPLAVAEGSNVMVVTVGGDDELNAGVADAIARLP